MDVEKELQKVIDKAKLYDKLLFLQNSNNILHCSFCRRSQEEIEKLVTGHNVYICSDCIKLSYEIIDEKERFYESQ